MAPSPQIFGVVEAIAKFLENFLAQLNTRIPRWNDKTVIGDSALPSMSQIRVAYRD